jgi:hypothetical protein
MLLSHVSKDMSAWSGTANVDATKDFIQIGCFFSHLLFLL